eukprot:457816-Ditylum_brightwellii.AAC.1
MEDFKGAECGKCIVGCTKQHPPHQLKQKHTKQKHQCIVCWSRKVEDLIPLIWAVLRENWSLGQELTTRHLMNLLKLSTIENYCGFVCNAPRENPSQTMAMDWALIVFPTNGPP